MYGSHTYIYANITNYQYMGGEEHTLSRLTNCTWVVNELWYIIFYFVQHSYILVPY